MKVISASDVFATAARGISSSSATACVVLSLTLGSAIPAHASPTLVDADSFSEGQALTNAFSGLTLTMNGYPDQTVVATVGYSSFLGKNVATTGTMVFGNTPGICSISHVWSELECGLLRVDFASPVSYVQIDLLFDDDDQGGIWAYDESGNLLGSMTASGDGRGSVPTATVSVSTVGAEISYVLAGGMVREGLYLDNLQYDSSITVAISAQLGRKEKCLRVDGKGTVTVAILGSAEFDVSLIDYATLSFAGLTVSTRGKGGLQCEIVDVNGDGAWDLLCKFTDDLDAWSPTGNEAILTGQLLDGTAIQGSTSTCANPSP